MDYQDIIFQLWLIYEIYETYLGHRLSKEEFDKYVRKLLETGNIFVCIRDGRVAGYVELWRLNYEQWGRLCCQELLHASEENVQDGKIAYVANIFIHPDWRNNGVFKELSQQYFKATKDCEYHVGERRTKRHQPISVFKINRRQYGHG